MDGYFTFPTFTNVHLPVIITAAMFVSFIFLDLARNEYKSLPFHIIFGSISTLLISVICDKNYGMVAWGLLSIPIIVILIGWSNQRSFAGAGPVVRVAPAPAPVPLKKKCCSKGGMV
jgi:hypothetical protein